MKVKLIAPARKPEWGESFWDLKGLCKLTGRKAGGTLLALPTLAALTPSDVEVVITDENVEPIDFDEEVDLVGISFYTSLAPRAYEIADEFRARKIPVILGGIHASMLPNEAIQHADSVVSGEAEGIWPQVVSDFREQKLQEFYRASGFPDLKNSLIPRWDLLKTDEYCYFTVQTGRGCPYDCEFCSVKIFNGRKYRHKPIDLVVEEIRTLQRLNPYKSIFFADDNLLAVPSYTKNLLRAIIPLKVKSWWCQSSINRLGDENLLSLMYEAGCRVVFVGFESVSQKSIESMNKKKVNDVSEYKDVVKKAHAHGIAVFGSFVLGSDTDDRFVFEETTKFISGTDIAFSMINILTPVPGTRLYESLKNSGRLLSNDWRRYDGESVIFEPCLISEEELEKGREQVLQHIYSYDALYRRLKNLWSRKVLVRSRTNPTSRFTKGRILFSIRSFLQWDKDRICFILKSLWDPNCTSITNSVLVGLSFHDYCFQSREKN